VIIYGGHRHVSSVTNVNGLGHTNEATGEAPYILLLLDVLGFEGLLRARGLQTTRDLYDELIQFVRQQDGGVSVVPIPDEGGVVHPAVGWLTVDQCYFSDTLMFWTPFSHLSVWGFLEMSGEIVCRCLELGFPVRGAIAVGSAVLDKNTGVYLGEPLVEAARVERAGRWIGVSLGPSFSAPPYNRNLPLNSVLAYRGHQKVLDDPLITGLVLDWPRVWRSSRTSDLLATLKSYDVDLRYASYYAATRTFVEYSAKNHDWYLCRDRMPIEKAG
jgi:hypothetical protein